MKQFRINHRSIIARLLLLLVFISLSCTQRNKRIETIDSEGKVADQPDKKTTNTDTIKLKDRLCYEIVCARENLKIRKVIGPFKTNVQADSVCWELLGASPGITIEPGRGTEKNCFVTIIRENNNSTGEIILKTTPFKTRFTSKSSEVKFLIEKCADPCQFRLDQSRRELPSFNDSGYCNTFREQLSARPASPDSITWEFRACSAGLKINLPGNKIKGTNIIPSFQVSKNPLTFSGTVTFHVVIYKAGCNLINQGDFVFWFGNTHRCARDTAFINMQRRQNITEFRDLLYMYAKTTSSREKEYFKIDAKNKLIEIRNWIIDSSPGNELQAIFDDPGWLNPVVVPLYDKNRCYISGIKVTQK